MTNAILVWTIERRWSRKMCIRFILLTSINAIGIIRSINNLHFTSHTSASGKWCRKNWEFWGLIFIQSALLGEWQNLLYLTVGNVFARVFKCAKFLVKVMSSLSWIICLADILSTSLFTRVMHVHYNKPEFEEPDRDFLKMSKTSK